MRSPEEMYETIERIYKQLIGEKPTKAAIKAAVSEFVEDEKRSILHRQVGQLNIGELIELEKYLKKVAKRGNKK